MKFFTTTKKKTKKEIDLKEKQKEEIDQKYEQQEKQYGFKDDYKLSINKRKEIDLKEKQKEEIDQKYEQQEQQYGFKDDYKLSINKRKEIIKLIISKTKCIDDKCVLITDIKKLIDTYLSYFSTYGDEINKLLEIEYNIKEIITNFFNILQTILNIIKTTDKEKINKPKVDIILKNYIEIIKNINVLLYSKLLLNPTNNKYNILIKEIEFTILIKGIEFTIFLEEILNYVFDIEIKIYYNNDIIISLLYFYNNDIINFKNYLQKLDNKLYEYIVKIETEETNIKDNIKYIILELNNKFIPYSKIFNLSQDLSKINEIDFTKYDKNYNILKETIEGGVNKYKKTENKITVIYKKKQYTRVIYICERKKYIKINKTFMLLSKMKKL
jgi:hypothetical protein